jgi:hypothetical protein
MTVPAMMATGETTAGIDPLTLRMAERMVVEIMEAMLQVEN